MPAEKTQPKPTDDEQNGPKNRSVAWTLSDKIAVIASFAAMLQFVALVATIFAMMRTTKRQLRAYVFAEIYKIQISSTFEWQIVVAFKTSGQTPAYKISQITMCEIFDVPTDEAKFNLPDERRSKFSLPPNGKSFTTLTKHTGDDTKTLRNGIKALYVFGRVDYKDPEF